MSAPRPVKGRRGRTTHHAWLLAAWFAVSCLLVHGVSQPTARAEDADDAPASEVFARVIVETAPLRTGPGPGFRIAKLAARGETFRVHERATRGYWLRVELSDGSLAYVQGDMVYAHEVGPPSRRARVMAKVFAPPPLLQAHGEIAVSLGALSQSGFMAIRPSWLLGPVFGIEGNLAASVGASGRLFLGGAGGIVNLFPSWPIVPFFTGGGGIAYARPNADSFVLEEGTRSMLYAGGGLRFGFRHRIIVRIEGRGYALFNADNLKAQQENQRWTCSFLLSAARRRRRADVNSRLGGRRPGLGPSCCLWSHSPRAGA
ncbi:MAG: SH3 domain-containing protein [Myxococcales bacterium]